MSYVTDTVRRERPFIRRPIENRRTTESSVSFCANVDLFHDSYIHDADEARLSDKDRKVQAELMKRFK